MTVIERVQDLIESASQLKEHIKLWDAQFIEYEERVTELERINNESKT